MEWSSSIREVRQIRLTNPSLKQQSFLLKLPNDSLDDLRSTVCHTILYYLLEGIGSPASPATRCIIRTAHALGCTKIRLASAAARLLLQYAFLSYHLIPIISYNIYSTVLYLYSSTSPTRLQRISDASPTIMAHVSIGDTCIVWQLVLSPVPFSDMIIVVTGCCMLHARC